MPALALSLGLLVLTAGVPAAGTLVPAGTAQAAAPSSLAGVESLYSQDLVARINAERAARNAAGAPVPQLQVDGGLQAAAQAWSAHLAATGTVADPPLNDCTNGATQICAFAANSGDSGAGFWPGDDSNPYPGFYGYLVPRPAGCETAPVGSEHAGWVEAMGEWVMPYEAVRKSGDPRRTILAFLHGMYGVAATLGGWDAEAFTYKKPSPPPRT